MKTIKLTRLEWLTIHRQRAAFGNDWNDTTREWLRVATRTALAGDLSAAEELACGALIEELGARMRRAHDAATPAPGFIV